MILYFSLSGAWQVFRLNDVPKDVSAAPPSLLHSVLHELSKPHKSSTLPGRNAKTEVSVAFSWLALGMGIGMAATTVIGVILALRTGRSPRLVWAALGLGIALPVCFLTLT